MPHFVAKLPAYKMVVALASSSSLSNSSSSINFSRTPNPWYLNSVALSGLTPNFQKFLLFSRMHQMRKSSSRGGGLKISAVTEGSAKNSGKSEGGVNGGDSSVPSWAKPGSEEPPPWARNETQKDSSSFEFPFFVYLLASAVTAIAAIGSVFEYVNQNPVFGVISSDSAFYAPLLGFFAFTGIPTSAFLWYKSVQVANKEAEEQDRRDGFR